MYTVAMTATDTDRERLIHEAFGTKKAQAEMEAYARTSRFLAGATRDLMMQYPRKWVVAYDEKICAIGDTLDDVLNQLDEKGIPRLGTAVRFLDPHPPVWHV